MSRLSTVVGHGVYAGISYTVEHDMQLYSARNKLQRRKAVGSWPRLTASPASWVSSQPDALRRHVTVSPLRCNGP